MWCRCCGFRDSNLSRKRRVKWMAQGLAHDSWVKNLFQTIFKGLGGKRRKTVQHMICGPQNLKYLVSDRLQKMFAHPGLKLDCWPLNKLHWKSKMVSLEESKACSTPPFLWDFLAAGSIDSGSFLVRVSAEPGRVLWSPVLHWWYQSVQWCIQEPTFQ